MKKTTISEDKAQLIAKALGDPRRYEMLRRIRESHGPFSCESMRGCMDISPATLSHHMKELETAGLVEVERKGKFAYYTLRRDVLDGFLGRLRKDLA